MQLLTFTAGGLVYAIGATSVVEVLPTVPVRPVPQLPDYVLGMVAYRGRMIPVIDLPRRLTGDPARALLSTRLIIVEVAGGPSGEGGPARLGLIAENMVSTVRSEDAETVFPQMQLEAAPYLGRILRLGGQTVHMLVVERLLPTGVASGLLAAAVEPTTP